MSIYIHLDRDGGREGEREWETRDKDWETEKEIEMYLKKHSSHNCGNLASSKSAG